LPNEPYPIEQTPFVPAMTAASAPPPPLSVTPSIAVPSEFTILPTPQPVAEPVAVPAELPPSAVVVPTISADAPPEKPKRGWWRR
jgi:ribonuclease E